MTPEPFIQIAVAAGPAKDSVYALDAGGQVWALTWEYVGHDITEMRRIWRLIDAERYGPA